MTKRDFIEYLSHPEKLNWHSIDSLAKLVQEYPYFQAGRMLYLKNLHNQNSIEYEKNLHITSAYAPSGKVLYNLIKKKQEDGAQATEIKTVHPSTLIEVLPKMETVAILQELPPNKKFLTSNETMEKQENEFDELQLLEKEMLREAYRTSLTIDLLEEKYQESKPEIRNQKKGTYSFNDWLKVVSGRAPDSAVHEKAVQKKYKSDLIDNFLLEQTAKASPKPKTEFYSADSMAKKSIKDDETFVSETLASIYLKQGNLPKALRAYEILLVKHPEKIHIFAPLLEKIKNLLKEQKSK